MRFSQIQLSCNHCKNSYWVKKSWVLESKFCTRVCYKLSLKGKVNEKLAIGRKKLFGEKHPMYGKHHTAWSKQKMSQARLGRFTGTASATWKGENITYGGLHDWVAYHLGSPKKCDLCKTTSYHRYEWASRSRTYKRDLSDWIRLCVPCHRKNDYYQLPL